MSGETFDDLLHLVGPSLCKQNTNYKDSISAEERLAVTLRFLAQGMAFCNINVQYDYLLYDHNHMYIYQQYYNLILFLYEIIPMYVFCTMKCIIFIYNW